MKQSTRRSKDPTMSTAIEPAAPITERDENDDMSTQTPSSAPTSTSRSRRWWWIAAAVAVVVIAGLAWAVASGNGSTEEAADVTQRNFAAVVSTDLIQEESYDGTLGTVEADPIKAQSTGTVTSIAAAGTTVEQGDVLFAVDGEPVALLYGTTPAYRDLIPTEDTDTIVSRDNGTITSVVAEGTVIQQGDILYFVDGEPVVALYGDVPAYRTMADLATNLTGEDIRQLETALAALGFDGLTVDDEFTDATETMVEDWQESIGADDDGVVDLGEVVFIPGPVTVIETLVEAGDVANDGREILVVTGSDPATGDDILQLEEAMADLGYDADGALVVDGEYDEGTRAAVEAWQLDIGAEVDGIVHLGEVVFLPSAVRISDELAPAGTAVTPGVGVLAVSSADKVVTFDLPAEDQALLAVDDAVIVVLPDNTKTPATVVEVSAVATVAQNGSSVFEITVALDEPSVAAGLDEAPVDVEVVSDSVRGVVAVPVTALVALQEGGYAVEVDAGNGTVRLVGVEVGFYADGMVEVTSASLAVGDQVVVP
jgi:peptidoglycan hydrolase-like protein with peptidoglycan-binding domain